MKIAVTGGSGFIGGAVVNDLTDRGHCAVIIDRVNGTDIRDRDAVAAALADCDGVIHLAGVLGTGELFADPYLAVDININGTLNILKALEKTGGFFTGITMPQVWDNVYQATKNAAQRLSYAWMRHRGIRVSHVRAYNAFGPGQHVHGVQKIIPTFATRTWRGEPIPIWGTGSQTVDLVHVDDVARMLVDATAYGGGEVFDAATGTDLTVLEVAEMVIEAVHELDGPWGSTEFLPMRDGEHPVELHAEGEGWNLLDWKPEFVLNDLVETVRWYRKDRP